MVESIESKHWKSHIDEHNVYWLTFDKQNSDVNTLDKAVLAELHKILDYLAVKCPRGLIIQSGKKTGFIAGADIQQFKQVETYEDAYELIDQGQVIFQKLSKMPFTTVALIQGYCLGGGLELALACDHRIAVDDPKTKLGLPEVMLGVHPGWGGTVRLPRLIGALKAMELILTGKSVSGKTAKKLGIVDVFVPFWHAKRAALYFILEEVPSRKESVIDKFSNHPWVRPLIGKFCRNKLSKKVNPLHYPAPYAAVENWQDYGVTDEAFLVEAKSIAHLLITEQTRNLVRVFNLQEKLKHTPHTTSSFKPQHIHVVGAGVMGGDIAAWCALKGFKVTLQDENPEAIAKSLKNASLLFQKYLKEPHLVMQAKDRLIGDLSGEGVPNADIIIEAIIEQKEAKQALFNSLEKRIKPGALLCSNTSTLPLESLSEGMENDTQLIGLHFFNPVAKMPLVEVIYSDKTDKEIVEKGSRFVRMIDKLPLEVKSSPGFLVNRILLPYLLESIKLYEEGVPKAAIDKAAVEFGMPMGPIELADSVGLDICFHALHYLKDQIPALEIPKSLEEKIAKGELGRKTGKGYYIYKNNHAVKEPIDKQYQIPDDATDRMVLCMLNESVACWREKIIYDADFLDAGLIFGAGFPPFRGGPIHYIKEQGEEILLQRLKQLVQRYGDRFFPDLGWSMIDAA